MRADHLTFFEVDAVLKGNTAPKIAYVPVGCTEQHGPILPLGTDSLIAQNMAGALCERYQMKGHGGVVYPVVAYSPSRSNVDYPGSTTVGEDSFRNYVGDLSRSILAHGFDSLVFVCMHGPAEPALIELAFAMNQAQFRQGEKVRPVLVLGITKFGATFQKILGSLYGKHADFKEFLLLYKCLGTDFFKAEKLAALKTFAEEYRCVELKSVSIPGVPMQYRSVDGVVGLPWPQADVDYIGLSESLWDNLLTAFEACIDHAFDELESL